MATSYTCRKIAIACREQPTMDYGGEIEEGDAYVVHGFVLPDGRLLSLDAVSGDTLWASVDAFSPNADDFIVSVEIGETQEVDLDVIREADANCTVYGDKSLLTADEARRYELQYKPTGGTTWECPGEPSACRFASKDAADIAGDDLREQCPEYNDVPLRVVDSDGSVVTEWEAL